MMKHHFKKAPLSITFCLFASITFAQQKLSPAKEIKYCADQAEITLKDIPSGDKDMPRTIENGSKEWRYVNYRDWCSGFWSGILWKLYEATGDDKWKTAADKYTRELTPQINHSGFDHDLGFIMFNSFGAGYRLTKNADYKPVILRSADSLATLFNPKVGTILSWPGMVKVKNWPHNTIIDNMMNLELLFWASKNGGSHKLYDIAVKHAETTMQNHFRPDYSAYHVVVYDTVTGKKIKGVTAQGYADNSMWARGQAWAIYGFTMCYRETKKPEFLDFAQHVADTYLKRLPEDKVPFYDFDDPAIPNVPKDASAAAISASALLELSQYAPDKTKAANYRKQAIEILTSLSSANYQSRDVNSAFLLHSTGHKPANSEINVSIIYADYYYLEALMRLKKLEK
ncbi:MAG TPA: glycoside hydrolase family 88 protein [Mucilaginibacter sp.]|jgi:unsaturated chondroitin disaccharide hydrolase